MEEKAYFLPKGVCICYDLIVLCVFITMPGMAASTSTLGTFHSPLRFKSFTFKLE